MRILLGALAAIQFVIGLWALFLPVAFYEAFPYGGTPWVALLPPYNEHLVRDVGAGTLALGVALALAAWWLDRRVVITAVVAFLTSPCPTRCSTPCTSSTSRCSTRCSSRPGSSSRSCLAVAVLVLVARDRRVVPVT